MKIKLFLFGFIIAVLLNNACFFKYPRDGIYLIPKGYTGDVIILFNQSDGVIPEIENGLFVYKIPEDGILKVKTKGYTGIVNQSYFYVDNNNQRQMIEYLRVTGDRNPAGEPQNKFGNISQNQYENTVYVMNTGGLGSLIQKTVSFNSQVLL